MKRWKITPLLLLIIITFLTSVYNVQAATITTNAYYVVNQLNDPPTLPPIFVDEASDPKSATSGDITSHVEYSEYDMVTASATSYANVDGTLAVSSSCGSGSPYLYGLYSVARWSNTYVNDSEDPKNYSFEFTIPKIILDIWDFCHCGSDTAGYLVNILFNGSVIWESQAELKGGYILNPDYTLTTSGTDIGLQKVDEWGYVAKYQSAPYSAQVVKEVGGKESFTIEYYMKVWTSGIDFEQGADASIGDPFTLTGGTITVSGGAPSAPIPEPSTLLLLGSGLAGIVCLRKKNR